MSAALKPAGVELDFWSLEDGRLDGDLVRFEALSRLG